MGANKWQVLRRDFRRSFDVLQSETNDAGTMIYLRLRPSHNVDGDGLLIADEETGPWILERGATGL
jgi:hypothetical protein